MLKESSEPKWKSKSKSKLKYLVSVVSSFLLPPADKKTEEKMEVSQAWRLRFSFRNGTIVVCFVNLIIALFLLQAFLSSASSSQPDSALLKHIKESEEIRLAMQPWELIKRVREIEQESYTEQDIVQQKDTKQTAAVDLSKRLNNSRVSNDASSLKALEEWRKRKMERARQRELEKNGTATSGLTL